MDALSSPFLFIVGRGRSGTTLLRAMFDSHPDMAIPPESHFIVPMGHRRRRYEAAEGFDAATFVADLCGTGFRDWGLSEDETRATLLSASPATYPDAARTLFASYAERHGKRRYGEKTPVNVRNISYLAGLFPEAVFIHIIRDGRDVTLSYLSVPWGPTRVAESTVYWKLAVERGRKEGSHLTSSRYREVRYEDLVASPEPLLQELCSFVDLPFDPVMLRYHERAADVTKGALHPDARRNLSLPPTVGLRDWRSQMGPRDLAVFEAIAGRTLERFGYERAMRQIPLAARLRAGLDLAAAHIGRARGRVAKVRGGGRRLSGRSAGQG